MPPRKVYKHKKSYVSRPIGRGGQTFRCFHKQRLVMYLGGQFEDVTTVSPARTFTPLGSTSFVKADVQFGTTPTPFVVRPATLNELIYETKYVGSDFANPTPYSTGAIDQTNYGEAKYPDMFHYRYITPVYYGINNRVIRCRTIIDSSESDGWTPTPNDLQSADLSWQLPIKFYWRADYDNLDSFYPFYTPGFVAQTPSWNCSQPGYYDFARTMKSDGAAATTPWEFTQDTGLDPADTTFIANSGRLHEMLVNKRFSLCTVNPNADCIMSMKCNFKTSGLDGTASDVRNTAIYSDTNAQRPISAWLRNYYSNVHLPGQSNSSGHGIMPGDLFMLPVVPELNSNYMKLLNSKLSTSQPKMRLAVEYEVTTSLILKGSEWVPDVVKWGGTAPSS